MAISNRTVFNARHRVTITTFTDTFQRRSEAEAVAEAFRHFGIAARIGSFRIGPRNGRARNFSVRVFQRR